MSPASSTTPTIELQPLTPGASVGPYTVGALLGTGGMGHVYRAHDPRIGRDVALKVVAGLSADAETLARFEREARTTGMVNHPNIMAIYDVGIWQSNPYVVTELLEGTTLQDLLAHEKRLPPHTAIAYAIAIAHGLDAAHRKEIVHRDLKPSNVFVTNEGTVKILDFGLAKLMTTRQAQSPDALSTSITQSGVVLGTVPYMSPEQIRSEPADDGSDIFSLGGILYEMVAGRRAFDRDTLAETMAAILYEDAPPLSTIAKGVPEALDNVVQRCLEKRRQDRFHSAHDLSLALEAIHIGSAIAPVTAMRTPPAARAASLYAAVALAVLGAAVIAYRFFPISGPANATPVLGPDATFERLTFRRGWVSAARFAPDGDSVVYSAAWDGAAPQVFLLRTNNPESRSLELTNADLLALSRTGELALLRDPQLSLNIYHRLGTFARVSLGGGAPRDVLQDVRYADFAPDGRDVAVIRDVGDRRRLEYPPGRILYDTPKTESNTVVNPRVSPDGERVAFFEGFGNRVSRWSVNVIERNGVKRTLSRDWFDWWRLDWSPDGQEVWFAASKTGSASALYAVSLTGTLRRLLHVPGTIELHDVAADGRVLLSTNSYRTVTRSGGGAGRPMESDLSWLDGSAAVALSHDGRTLLLDEHGEGGGPTNAVYIRPTDGSPAIRLGSGRPLAISPDGVWVLATLPGSPAQLFQLPTGAGDVRPIAAGKLEAIRAAQWFPDNSRLLLAAAEPGHGLRLYVQALDRNPQAITPDGFDIHGNAIAPNGRQIAAVGPDGEPTLWNLDGPPSKIPGLTAGDIPVGWTTDGDGLYVCRGGTLPTDVYLVDVASGRKRLWRSLMPPDAAGVGAITSVLVTPDGRFVAYSYEQTLSELYLVKGVR